MPRAYTCSLQAGEAIVFPDRCVMCGKAQPGATHRYAVKQSLSLSRGRRLSSRSCIADKLRCLSLLLFKNREK